MRIHTKRSGLVLMEVIVAAAILLIVAASIGKFLAALSVQRQSADARQTALRTLDNLAEQLQAQPWDDIDDEVAEHLPLPPEIKQRLRNAKLGAQVSREAEPVESKRVTLHLTWRDPRLPRDSTVALTTWIFPVQEAQP